MRYQSRSFLFGSIALLLFSGLGVLASGFSFDQTHVSITALDVGQGDAILLKFPHSQEVLIDGGPDGSVHAKLGKHLPFLDRSIDMVVLTHPDGDHITGLIDVIKNYRVDRILTPPVFRDTQAYHAFHEIATKRHIPIIAASPGQIFEFASGVQLQILASGDQDDLDAGLPLNDSSIVARMIYHDFDALLTGDASSVIEQELISAYPDLSVDVLKVGHHGSRFSTSKAFLESTKPSIALISVGRDNTYGHPHRETLHRLEEAGVRILRTDQYGDVTVRTDGKTFDTFY